MTPYLFSDYSLGFFPCLCILMCQYFLLAIFLILINVVSELIGMLSPKVYVCELIPFVLFLAAPVILGYLATIIMSVSQNLIDVIDPFMYFTSIFRIIGMNTFQEVCNIISIMLLVFLLLFMKRSIKRRFWGVIYEGSS